MEVSYKFILVGDGDVGKTKFYYRHAKNQFNQRHNVNVKLEIHPMDHDCTFENHDCGEYNGDIYHRGLYPSEYYDEVGNTILPGNPSEGAIVMYDLTDVYSYDHVRGWVSWIHSHYGDIPIVVCGNKIDKENNIISANQKSLLRGIDGVIGYYDISCKNGQNFEESILHLIRSEIGEH